MTDKFNENKIIVDIHTVRSSIKYNNTSVVIVVVAAAAAAAVGGGGGSGGHRHNLSEQRV
jgi:hypothetical protein